MSKEANNFDIAQGSFDEGLPKRQVLWYNPPYNANVDTNIGKEFLKLIDDCFPPFPPLKVIFNRSKGSLHKTKTEIYCFFYQYISSFFLKITFIA